MLQIVIPASQAMLEELCSLQEFLIVSPAKDRAKVLRWGNVECKVSSSHVKNIVSCWHIKSKLNSTHFDIDIYMMSCTCRLEFNDAINKTHYINIPGDAGNRKLNQGYTVI